TRAPFKGRPARRVPTPGGQSRPAALRHPARVGSCESLVASGGTVGWGGTVHHGAALAEHVRACDHARRVGGGPGDDLGAGALADHLRRAAAAIDPTVLTPRGQTGAKWRAGKAAGGYFGSGLSD